MTSTNYCKNFSMVAYFRDTDARKVNLTRLSCGMWSCDYCSKAMQSAWRQHLNTSLPNVQPASAWYLLTLTIRSNAETTQAASYKRFQHGFDVLMKRARRVWKKISYVRMYEAHKTGVLHMHVVITGLSSFVKVDLRGRNGKRTFRPLHIRSGHRGTWKLQTWWKKMSIECGLGFMADVREAPTMQAVRYVTKYMTKDMQSISIRGLRHVQTSRDIKKPKPRGSDQEWIVTARLLKSDLFGDERVYDLNRKTSVDHLYWKVNEVYPPINDD